MKKCKKKTLACVDLSGDNELGWLQFQLRYQPSNRNQNFPPGFFHALCCSFAAVFREENHGIGSFAQQQYFLRSEQSDGVICLDNTEPRIIDLTIQGLPGFMFLIKKCLEAARRVIKDWKLTDAVQEESKIAEDRLFQVCEVAREAKACVDNPAQWLLCNCPMLALTSNQFDLKERVFNLRSGQPCTDLQQLLLDSANDLKSLSLKQRSKLRSEINALIPIALHSENMEAHKTHDENLTSMRAGQ